MKVPFLDISTKTMCKKYTCDYGLIIPKKCGSSLRGLPRQKSKIQKKIQIFRIKRDFENKTIRSMRLKGGANKGQTIKSLLPVFTDSLRQDYMTKASGVVQTFP